jgi:hypothetical protein
MQVLPEMILFTLGATIPLLAKVVGIFLKARVTVESRKLRVTSPSGEVLVIELKGQMSEEETTHLVKRLENLEKQPT